MKSLHTPQRSGHFFGRLLVATCLGSLTLTIAQGADKPWSGTTEVAYVTDYLWRGAKLSGDSIQPLLSATYGDGLMLAVAGSYGLKKDSPLDPSGSGRYGETDYLASYTFLQNAYSLTVGGQVYGIDDLGDPNTGDKFKHYFESVVSLSLKAKFNPAITFWREFGRLQTNYVEFSASESWELNKQARFSVRPYVGFYENSQHYFGADFSVNYEFGNQFYGRATVTAVKNNAPGVKHERANFSVATGRRW